MLLRRAPIPASCASCAEQTEFVKREGNSAGMSGEVS